MPNEIRQLDATFAALSDPTRREILARLASGETSVTALAKPFNMTMPAVSKHLKVLEKAGLITRTRDAQLRPCRLEAPRLKEASDWLAKYREFWESSFSRLDEILKEMQPDPKNDKKKGRTKKWETKRKLRLNRARWSSS